MELRDLMKTHQEIGLDRNPRFDRAYRRHDWRNYIPDELAKVWEEMSSQSRISAYLVAKKQADQENWD